MSDVGQEVVSQAEGFYRAFEERHRGSRELIKSRLAAYLRFVEPLKVYHTPALATDLGCGRGEWLELLTENGFEAKGVDLDDGMLEACRERGLRAEKREAIEFLKSLPDESQSIVSGFHIAEHLAFPDLQALVQESFRVLKPGGLLILETPNPENLKVSSISFYLDPTHHHPLPPDLLSFIPEYYGFSRIKIVRLQEAPALRSAPEVTLNDVLSGASPDYSIVAQKAGDNSLLSATVEAFNDDYGLSLGRLVERFDGQLAKQAGRVENLSLTLEGLSEMIHRLDARLAEQMHVNDRHLQELELVRLSSLVEMKNRALEAHDAEIARLHRHIAWLETAAQGSNSQVETLRRELELVYRSTSWGLTAPLRSLSTGLKWFVRGTLAWVTLKPGSRPRRIAQRITRPLETASSTGSEGADTRLSKGTSTPLTTQSKRNETAEFPSTLQPLDGIKVKGLISTWDADLSAESEGVKRLYRRLANARRSLLDSE
jgi:O-antigen chain-terminating methyltransferase